MDLSLTQIQSMLRTAAGRFLPSRAFACGARSVRLYGQEWSRRHFASSRDPMLAGCVDLTKLLSASLSRSGVLGAIGVAAPVAATSECVSATASVVAEASLVSPILARAIQISCGYLLSTCSPCGPMGSIKMATPCFQAEELRRLPFAAARFRPCGPGQNACA